MTLPASGTITTNQVNVELGRAGTTAIDLGWVRSLVNTNNSGSGAAANPGTPFAMNQLYGLTYYQRIYSSPSDRAYLQTRANCDCDCYSACVTACNAGCYSCACFSCV